MTEDKLEREGPWLRHGLFPERYQKTAGIASINKTQLSAFPVVLPPLDQQQDFARHAEAVESIARRQVGASSKAEASFDAVLARAFGSLREPAATIRRCPTSATTKPSN